MSNAQYNRVDLAWVGSTDNIGVKGYMIYRNGLYVGTSLLNKFADKLVVPLNTYSYYLVAYDGSSNKSAASNTVTVTNPAGGDTIPPTQPTGLSVNQVTATQVGLTWLPSTDNFGVSGYMVYRDGVYFASVATTSYVDTKVATGTTYTYYLVAFDGGKNKSLPSSTVTATTPAI